MEVKKLSDGERVTVQFEEDELDWAVRLVACGAAYADFLSKYADSDDSMLFRESAASLRELSATFGRIEGNIAVRCSRTDITALRFALVSEKNKITLQNIVRERIIRERNGYGLFIGDFLKKLGDFAVSAEGEQ